MTFEELLQKVQESKNLHHCITELGFTYIRESFADDQSVFAWALTHPGKGFESKEKGICAVFGSLDGEPKAVLTISPDQLVTLRETLSLHCEYWAPEDQDCLELGNC